MTRHRPTLADARRRLLTAQARREELAADVKAGKLLDAGEVKGMVSGMVIAARTRLLAVPSQLQGRRPDLTPADLRALDELLREVLEELASGGSAALEAVKP